MNYFLGRMTFGISNKQTHVISLVITQNSGVEGGDFLLTVDKLVNTSKCNLDCKLFYHKIGYFTPILAIKRMPKALILHVFSI